MLKTIGPVIIMTKAELEALVKQTAKEAAAEALKSIQAWKAGSAPETTKAPAEARERPRLQDRGSTASEDCIIRLPEVEKAVGLEKTAIYKLIKAGDFPPQIKLGKHASGWSESAVQDWIRQRAKSGKPNSA